MSASSLKLPALAEVRAELARRSLAEFVKRSWHVLEPTTPLAWNWHIDAMCEHVQATLEDWIRKQQDPEYEQRIQNLLINVPPGSMKSRVVSVCAPAWMWTKWPEWRVICVSANPRVSLRDADYAREIIQSAWYQETFRPDWRMKISQDAKSNYANTRGGFRLSFGFRAKITGDRADALIIDDPHDAEEVNSDAERLHVLDRWDNAIRNRVNDLRTSVRIGIMQRLHEADWSGHVLAKGGWEHLCIPQEYEPQRYQPGARDYIPPVTPIGWSDPRTEPGELLFPERFTPEVLTAEKIELGSRGYAGQHQQRPAPGDGDIFKRSWFQFYAALPERFDEVIQSWDMSFKDTKGSDYVVGQIWGRKGADKFLLDEVRERMDFPSTLRAVRTLTAKWPQAHAKLVEDKANGPAVISTLQHEISGLIAVQPDGSKEARAHAVAPTVEAGNVYLPSPERHPWVDDFLTEVCGFPGRAFDDRVDAMTQALRRFLNAPTGSINTHSRPRRGAAGLSW